MDKLEFQIQLHQAAQLTYQISNLIFKASEAEDMKVLKEISDQLREVTGVLDTIYYINRMMTADAE